MIWMFLELAYSSLTVNSSLVGRRGNTKENNDDERSLRKRRCSTPGCMVGVVVVVLGGCKRSGV
jgi:hypothetical protein